MTIGQGQGAILYFLTQRGCSHCMLMRPVVDSYRQNNLGNLFVYELDIMQHPQIDDWRPKATPAFALKLGGILVATYEGTMSAEKLDRFVQRGALGKEIDNGHPTARRRRRPARPRREAPDPGDDQDEGDEREPVAGSDRS